MSGLAPPNIVSAKRQRAYQARWETCLQSVEAYDLADLLKESADDHVPWAESTKRRRAKLLERFISMHESSPRWLPYKNNEFEFETLYERIQDFLSFIVTVSQGMDNRSKLSYTSLTTIRWDILGLATQFCETVRMDSAIRKSWSIELTNYCQHIATVNDLPKTHRPKFYFGLPELLLLAETAIAASHFLDNTLQHIFLWTCMLYTAARPGSFLRTDAYPEWYVKYEHINICRTNIPLEFLIEFKIVAWKGGHTFHPWFTIFRLSSVRTEAHLLADPGLLLIALGLRRGAFADYSDLDSLLEGRERTLRWKPDFLSLPFFVASSPKGISMDYTRPMRYNPCREFLKKICQLSGIGWENMTAYCFRRGAATTMSRVLGTELTKSILHHDQHSETIHNHYIIPGAQADLVSAVAYGENAHIGGQSKFDAPALFRAKINTENFAPLSLEQALLSSSELRLLHIQRDVLRDYVKSGDIPDLDSKELEPIIARLLPEEKEFLEGLGSEATCLGLYGKLMQRCKKVLGEMRARYRNEMFRHAYEQQAPLTIDDLDRRLEEAAQPRDIVTLLRGLVVAEQEVATDTGDDLDVIDCPSVVKRAGKNNNDADAAIAEDVDAPERVMNARRVLLSELVAHQDPHRGPQPCPICQADTTLPEQTRNHVHQSWSKVIRHMMRHHEQEQTRQYLTDVYKEGSNSKDAEGNNEGLVARGGIRYEGHQLGMREALDRYFF